MGQDDNSAAGPRILAVDDSHTNRLIVTRLLTAMGYQVESASSGEAAVDVVSRERFDLVLMDLQMPGIGGMEAARQIRAMPSGSADTPIIALTADVADHHRAAYKAVGMNDVVAKPIVPPQLAQTIAEVLARASA